jgi:5-methylcytosine-specific restriction endonuclease McrA
MRTRWRYPRYEFGPVVRRAALKRARYRCERCGEQEQLEVHHIGNRQDRSLFNAQVLCVPCHSKEHRERRLLTFKRPSAWAGQQG